MCSTLGQASRRFRSRCPIMKTPATAMENSPITSSRRETKGPSPAIWQRCVTRSRARKAQAVTPAASVAPTTPAASP